YELCYRQYESEMRETDQIYQRVSFVLVFLSLLGGIIYNLGRIDILRSTFVRVDIFLYYSSLIVAILLLASSVTYCILFALPRKGKYKTLASMDLWQKWRQNYERYRKEADQSSEGSIDDAMMKEITKKLAEAQANNAPINEKRRQYFQMSVLMASLAVIPVALQSLFYVILKVQGV
ncbi:MAG: hypothetical protein NTZ12_07140, partial [Candidatus Aminicenantes bacterium]|nr:hypothetical protein [Candidatus Aminicenantes bacterium]